VKHMFDKAGERWYTCVYTETCLHA